MITRRGAVGAAGVAGLMGLSPAWGRGSRRAPDWQAGLDNWLEAQREAWGVTGMAVALIRDGVVVHRKGYGRRSVESDAPVTVDTLFRAGSTTKAFGAASIATLVDEGALDWERPIRAWLPDFVAPGGPAHQDWTLRDLLSHRTGLPRHDLLWYGNAVMSRAEMAARLRHLPVTRPPRARYQYNNLAYALAGHVAEVVTGQSWEALARARLLGPLGMTRANLFVAEMMRDPDHALGHAGELGGPARAVALRHDALLGPAGALNVSIADFARWARMQLGRGEIDGRRVVSTASVAAMWEPLILTAGTPREPEFDRAFYGMGWRLDSWRGQARVAHGGDLNGFTSRVTLLPQAGIAVVVLCNHGGHPLPNAITPDLLDRLLGLPPGDHAAKTLERRRATAPAAAEPAPAPARIAGTAPSRALSAYAGVFRDPGYGDVTVELAPDGQGLRARYNAMPLRLEHWHYDVFETVTDQPHHGDVNGLKVVFEEAEDGTIAALRIVMEELVGPTTFNRAG
jgi:CubicO group peptidase (beta-lactamase class C family)